MHKTRVYVDTSVYGGVKDDEFGDVSRRFFDQMTKETFGTSSITAGSTVSMA